MFKECRTFLKETARAPWYETSRFKNDQDGYVQQVTSNTILLRIEISNVRRFYWLNNLEDAKQFNEFITTQLHLEAHEIILGNKCRLFYDIDLKLDYFQKYEFAEHYNIELFKDNEICTMNIIGKTIADIYKNATLLSLREHGNEIDDTFDWMFCMRNRPDGDNFKISIHIITNIYVQLKLCEAIAEDVKSSVLVENYDSFGITDDIAECLSCAIDSMQYRHHGSLGLPKGVKNTSAGEYANNIVLQYNIPLQHYFITIPDQFSIMHVENYNVTTSNFINTYVDEEFISTALTHVSDIQDYNPAVFDIKTSILKGTTMYVRRYAPSECSICNRTHDNDNTLFLMFDSERRIASWKCMHASMKPLVFYQEESGYDELSEMDIDAFAKKHEQINTKTQSKASTKAKGSTKKKLTRNQKNRKRVDDIVEQNNLYRKEQEEKQKHEQINTKPQSKASTKAKGSTKKKLTWNQKNRKRANNIVEQNNLHRKEQEERQKQAAMANPPIIDDYQLCVSDVSCSD